MDDDVTDGGSNSELKVLLVHCLGDCNSDERYASFVFVPSRNELALLKLTTLFDPDYLKDANMLYAVLSYFAHQYSGILVWEEGDPFRDYFEDIPEPSCEGKLARIHEKGRVKVNNAIQRWIDKHDYEFQFHCIVEPFGAGLLDEVIDRYLDFCKEELNSSSKVVIDDAEMLATCMALTSDLLLNGNKDD